MVHEHECPTRIGILREGLFHGFDLSVRDDVAFFPGCIQGQEQDVLIDK